jgi:outer membrane protein OmpA-like peptidoglycan-associated protein
MKQLPAIALLVALCSPSFALAQEPPAAEISKDAIVCALDPSCNKAAAAPTRHRRGLTISGQTADNAPPSINLNIAFEYNSAELAPDARITLDTLGEAMRDRRLSGYNFLIAGHTDAKGNDAYNMRLSLRRAETVKRYLVEHYKVVPDTVSVNGFGRSKPLDPARPDDPINRRVEIINTSTATAQQ